MSYMRRYASPPIYSIPMARGRSMIIPRQAMGTITEAMLTAPLLETKGALPPAKRLAMRGRRSPMQALGDRSIYQVVRSASDAARGLSVTPIHPGMTVTPIHPSMTVTPISRTISGRPVMPVVTAGPVYDRTITGNKIMPWVKLGVLESVLQDKINQIKTSTPPPPPSRTVRRVSRAAQRDFGDLIEYQNFDPIGSAVPQTIKRSPFDAKVRNLLGMGSNQSMPQTFRRAPRSMDGYGTSPRVLSAAKRFGVMGTLGDAPTTDSTTTIVDPVVSLQQQQLAQLQVIANSQVAFAAQESFQRYLQIAATLAIPLSAAIWRMIFKGGRKVSEDVGV